MKPGNCGKGLVNDKMLECSLHLVGTQAPGADVYPFRDAVNHHFDALGVRLPLAIGSYMRMAVLLAEGNAFSANIAFGHAYPPFNHHD